MQRSARNTTTALWAGVIAATMALTGCTPQEVPMITDSETSVGGSLGEHMGWLEAEIDKAIATSGVKDGWFKSFTDEDIYWTDDPKSRYEIFGSLVPRDCGRGGQLIQSFIVRDVPEWSEIADRMRAAWEAEGWTVTDVFSIPRPSNPYFRADREDGATLPFDANERGLILSVETPCSYHATMSAQTLKLDEREAYREEMLKRPYEGATE